MSGLILLITGSRDWRNKDVVGKAICDAIGRHNPNPIPEPFDWSSVTIRHGNAKGADTLAHRLAQAWEMKVQFIAADWNTFGKAAGPIRNTRLVAMDPPADEVATFAFPSSRGTFDCADKARAAGIPVFDYGVSTRIEDRP